MSFTIQPPPTREQRRWLRNDAHLWLRPDHARFENPRYIESKYSPDQPRVPAGGPEGGRWTSGRPSSADVLLADIFTDALPGDGVDGEAAELPVQLAYLGPAFQVGRFAVQKGIEAALGLYAALSGGNGLGEKAVAVFNAADFAPGADPQSAISAVGRLTRDEVDLACPGHELVQSMTDRAAAAFNRADFTAAVYGTAVHTKLADDIKNLLNPNLLSEVSVLKTIQETGAPPKQVSYGQKGSVRIDVLENAGNYTVCVYDIKTGSRALGPSRMREIAQSVFLNFPGTLRIVVTETRPRR